MESVVLVIHLILALALIGLILLQRSEGGGLGMGSSGGLGAFASAQTTATALTRATAICATLFFLTSLLLGILAGLHHKQDSIMDRNSRCSATLSIYFDRNPDSFTRSANRRADSSGVVNVDTPCG